MCPRIDLSGEVKQEQSKKIEDLTNALVESQKRITSLETMNQVLREKLVNLKNGQKANTETLTKIVEKIAKDEGAAVPFKLLHRNRLEHDPEETIR